jgi:hypothetical protein
MTVRQLGAECDSAELIEWMAYERLEHFGPLIDDLRAAYGPAAIINNMRGLLIGKDAEMLSMDKLIPWFERQPEKLLFDPSEPGYDAEAHAAALRGLLMRFSGDVNQ